MRINDALKHIEVEHIPNFGEQFETEDLHPYYAERERKNMAMVDCWGKALWFAFWLAVGTGLWYLLYKGFCCWLWH